MTTDKQAPVARHWIDGNWCDSAKHQDSFDPATGEKIGSYAVGGADEAREAVATTLRAFLETDWKTHRELRARVLLDKVDRVFCAALKRQLVASTIDGLDCTQVAAPADGAGAKRFQVEKTEVAAV